MNVTQSTYSKIASITCFVACAGDFAVTFIIGFMHKGYNFLTQSESFLGTEDSPVAKYMNAWEIIFTLLFLACAYSLFKAGFSKSRWQLTVVWLIVVYGLGEGLGSGLFPYNHIGNELTLSGKLHSLFSGIGVAALVATPFILLKTFPRKDFPKLNRFFLFVAISGPILVIIFLFSRQDLFPLRGLWQRLFLLDYYLMLMVLSLQATNTKVMAS